jgi:MinD-like ATPase involved in chromosome partitioning or flagellar assembly
MIILTKAKKSSPVSKILKMRNHSDEIIKSLKGKHKKNIFLVPNDKNIYDSQLHGEPISHYSPSSKASLSYKKIANEIMKWD